MQRFPAPHDTRQFLEACQALDFRTGEGALAKARFPCVAFLKATARPVLIVKADRERLLYFEAGSATPLTAPAAHFESDLILVRHNGTDSQAAPADGFGWRWFATELLRHKRVWRDVLLASLVIQLIALATPLCTQVVIDKVVVHHTMSTLAVIAAGARHVHRLQRGDDLGAAVPGAAHRQPRRRGARQRRCSRHLLRLPPAATSSTGPPGRWSRACTASRRSASS